MLSLDIPQYSLSFGCHPNSIQSDMTSAPSLGSLSAPPHVASCIVISLSAPAQKVPVVSIPHPLPQAVAIEEAAEGSLDSTLEYWIEAEDVLELAVNVVVSLTPPPSISDRHRAQAPQRRPPARLSE